MEWWLSLYVWNAEGACPQWHITERGGETLNMLSLRKAGDSVSVRGGVPQPVVTEEGWRLGECEGSVWRVGGGGGSRSVRC